jgi:hypothetical protein
MPNALLESAYFTTHAFALKANPDLEAASAAGDDAAAVDDDDGDDDVW